MIGLIKGDTRSLDYSSFDRTKETSISMILVVMQSQLINGGQVREMELRNHGSVM